MGTFNDEEGASSCKSCKLGFSSAAGSTNETSDCKWRVVIEPKDVEVHLSPDIPTVKKEIKVTIEC